MSTFSVFITLMGFVIGLGAVTVIDFHGYLARRSAYWTEATIRTHRVTKPLIWVGIFLVALGHVLLKAKGLIPESLSTIHFITIGIMIINGCFLTFIVSPEHIRREKAGLARELPPKNLQKKITMSFVVSVISWWGLLLSLVIQISKNL